MPGGGSTQQQTQQTSVSQPWAPTQGLLGNIINRLGSQNTNVTGAQSDALTQLQDSLRSVPNFGNAAAGAVGSAFGTNTTPQQGMLTNAFNATNANLTPWASGANNDPFSNPAIRGLLDTTRNDITNQINSQFAAAGRDLSPANTTALARGLSQGEAGILTGQYNQNVGNQFAANNTLLGGAGSTAGGLTSQQLAQLNAQLGGIQGAGMLPGVYGAPAMGLLNAANQGYAQPFQNIGMLEGLTNPIASLGGQSTSTGTQTTTPPSNTAANVTGGVLGGLGLAAQFAPLLMSDERTKEDIAPVGILNDGSNVYAFRYRGDPSRTTHIGLLAQEVEQDRPDAVVEFGPARIKAVDYRKATERSRVLGLLNSMAA